MHGRPSQRGWPMTSSRRYRRQACEAPADAARAGHRCNRLRRRAVVRALRQSVGKSAPPCEARGVVAVRRRAGAGRGYRPRHRVERGAAGCRRGGPRGGARPRAECSGQRRISASTATPTAPATSHERGIGGREEDSSTSAASRLAARRRIESRIPMAYPNSWASSSCSRPRDRRRMEAAIVRPPLVYGPGVRANFLRMMRWVDRGLPLPLASVDNRRSPGERLEPRGRDRDVVHASRGRGAGVEFASDGEDLSTPRLAASAGGSPGSSRTPAAGPSRAAALGREARWVAAPRSIGCAARSSSTLR